MTGTSLSLHKDACFPAYARNPWGLQVAGLAKYSRGRAPLPWTTLQKILQKGARCQGPWLKEATGKRLV